MGFEQASSKRPCINWSSRVGDKLLGNDNRYKNSLVLTTRIRRLPSSPQTAGDCMRFFVRLLIVLVVLGAIGAIAAKPLKKKWEERNKPEFETEKVSRGDVVSYVIATGKIKPTETIKIGSFVSGPIRDMPEEIDFNEPVNEGDLMARVDPRLIKAQADAAKASLDVRKGEVKRTKAQLQLAINDENRAIKLREKKADFVSQAEMDRLRFAREQLEAAALIAEASVEQAQAQLAISQVNLDYTYIKAPKDGIIIDRKIEPGQTLAAQFQTPELFEIGVGMREKMHIYASVDENDIGMIQQAQDTDQPVTFTVNAYPEELFHGRIVQIRMSATELQSVVTYPVVVESPNPDLKLLPNMTADLSFKIDEHKNVLRVPNQAIRFLPDKKHVREEDQKVLDGSLWAKSSSDDDDEDDDSEGNVSAKKRTEANRSRNKRHVWVKDGEKLRAIEIETGMIDQEEGKTTEAITDNLKEGQELVTGIKKKKGGMFGG